MARVKKGFMRKLLNVTFNLWGRVQFWNLYRPLSPFQSFRILMLFSSMPIAAVLRNIENAYHTSKNFLDFESFLPSLSK